MNIIYNVTINVENEVAEEWLQWMLNTHLSDVMRTGMFLENHLFRLIGDEDSGGVTYAVQYRCESMEKYLEYKEKYAPALQADGKNRFGNRFTAFRSLLEVIK